MFPFPVGNLILIGAGLVLIYLAVEKHFEPLLLLPIGFGAIIGNVPYSSVMEADSFLRVIYDLGIKTELLPILLFIGIGAMCDFGYLFASPWTLLLAIPAHFGIFVVLLLSLLIGLPPSEAVSVGIIGAMDGPTAIYVTSKYAPELLASVAVAAYSYMSLIPILQVPISRVLTTRSERLIRMEYQPKSYSRKVKILFPIIVTLIIGVLAPKGISLVGALMFGNIMRESGVVDKLLKVSQEEIASITTLLLGITIGGTMVAEHFLTIKTLLVFTLGLVAFVLGLSFGTIAAKIANFFAKGRINPLLGATAVSAFPMAARTAHKIARTEDPDNWLLMHAVATNMGGQIASVIIGGIILTFTPILLGLA